MNMTGFTAFLLFGLIGTSLAYEIGTVHKYSYDTSVIVNEKCGFEGSPQAVGHKVKANVHLTNIWQSKNSKQKLIQIQVSNPKLLVPKKTSFEEHLSDLDKIVDHTSYLLWEEGSTTKIWEDPNESVSVRNLKRGIASLLQFRSKDERIKQDDVSGNCDVEYKVRGKSIRKRKGNCVHSQFEKTLSQPYGIRSASVQHQSTTDCELKDEKSQAISKCSVSEYVKMFSNTWHRPSLCINSKLEFSSSGTEENGNKYTNVELESVIEELKKKHDGRLESSSLESILIKQETKKKDLKTSVSIAVGNLKTNHLAELKSASAFYKLLPVFRAASKDDVLKVLKEENFEEIRPQLLDLVSACATESCLDAAFKYFSDEKEYDEQLERFIISLSIMPRPSGFVLKQLQSFLMKGSHDERIEASLLATLGTLLKTYSENYAIGDMELVENIRKFMENELKKCSSATCSLNYLRGLRNAAQPRSASLFLEYAVKGGKPALESVLALRKIPDRLLPPENQKMLLNVFNQVEASQDRSTRGIAAELILKQHPEPVILKKLLMRLNDPTDLEFSTFLSSKLSNMMSLDADLRKSVIKLLPDIFDINFGTLDGQSTVFTRPMLSIEGTNVTYGLEAEMLAGGLLKRSVFDVSFENAAGGSNLLSVGIFAEGLGGFAGSTSPEDENANPTAGMELGFLGSSLRPYVFFSSTSELMSHAWSGTASEQTPVLQCILAFSDDEKSVVLSNGMAVRGQLRGVLSSDASASIKISLWNRNSHSLVQTEGALLVRGSVSVDAGFVTTQGAIQFSGESGIDFKTDLEFYESPFTLCLQMEHPDIAVKFDVHRSTLIPGTKYQIKRSKKRTIKIPGRSFALNEKNNEMCHMLNSNN